MDALLLLVCVLACLLIVILTCTLLLYIVPVRSSIRLLVHEDDVRETLTVAWGLAGVRIRHDSYGTGADVMVGRYVLHTLAFVSEEATPPLPEKPEMEKQNVAWAKEEDRASSFPDYIRTIRVVRNLVHPALSLVSAIWTESRFDSMVAKITLGTGNPAQTGEIYGYYWAAKFILEARRIRINLEPVFDREVFTCDLEMKISLHRPILVIISAARFALHPAVREIYALSREGSSGAGAA